MQPPESRADVEALVNRAAVEAAHLVALKLPKRGKVWMTTDEVCAYLGVSRTTLWRWRDEYQLPFSELGKRKFYRRDHLHQMLQHQLTTAAPSPTPRGDSRNRGAGAGRPDSPPHSSTRTPTL